MKILIFCPYYPPHIGGLESHSDEFNKFLSQKGVDITVFTPQLPKDTPFLEIVHNTVKIIRFPAFEIISNYPLPKFWLFSFWKSYFNLLNDDRFDLIISRTRFFNTSILALTYAKIKKVRWIHIEHGSDFVKLSSKFKTQVAKLYDNLFGRVIFKCSSINISISQAVAGFVYKFDKRRSPVIYRGLDFENIDAIIPDFEFKNKHKGKIIISFVGRLYKWKGIENSIKAIMQLPEDIKERIIFAIIGDGEDYKYLKSISNPPIIMLGKLPRNQAIGILKVSDIYIHSSLPGGGLSTSLLEAMYCGCGIISTENEGAKEIISDNINGLLIKSSNPELIVEKLFRLIYNGKERKSFGVKAKKKIIETFSWNKSIERYFTYFY